MTMTRSPIKKYSINAIIPEMLKENFNIGRFFPFSKSYKGAVIPLLLNISTTYNNNLGWLFFLLFSCYSMLLWYSYMFLWYIYPCLKSNRVTRHRSHYDCVIFRMVVVCFSKSNHRVTSEVFAVIRCCSIFARKFYVGKSYIFTHTSENLYKSPLVSVRTKYRNECYVDDYA